MSNRCLARLASSHPLDLFQYAQHGLVPEKWKDFVAINTKFSPQWPVIDAQKEPLPTADEMAKVEDKRDQIDPDPFAG